MIIGKIFFHTLGCAYTSALTISYHTIPYGKIFFKEIYKYNDNIMGKIKHIIRQRDPSWIFSMNSKVDREEMEPVEHLFANGCICT